MSGPHRHEKHYLEGSPESGEDHGSKRVQTSGAYHGASSYHDCSQYPAPNRTQQPIQPSIQSPYQALEEHADDSANDYADEHADDHADEHANDYAVEYSDEYTDEYTEEDTDDGPDDYPLHCLIEDPIEQSFENPNRHLYQVSNAQQAHGGYQAVGAAQVTQAFESLGLAATSSSGAQPYAGEPAGVWAGGGERSPYDHDHPGSTPYGRVAQNFTGLEGPGSEPRYSPADDWWLRMSLANDHDLEKVAGTLERSVESVKNYVRIHNLRWTPQQDDQLRERNVGQQFSMPNVMPYLEGRHEDEVLARAKHLAWSDQPAHQSAQADIVQPDSQHYPMGTQWGRPRPAQASEEIATETKPATTDQKFSSWKPEEVRTLWEYVACHGPNSWEGAEDWLVGRSRDACRNKYRAMCKAGPGGAVFQPLPDNESGDQEQDDHVSEILTRRDFDSIKFRLAQGHRFSEIVGDRYRNFRQRTIIKFMYSAGWRPWTPDQDQKLLELHQQAGARWDQISSRLPYPQRIADEVEARFEYLRRVQNGELPRTNRRLPYFFDEEDDRYIRLRAAQGMSFGQMQREEFPDLLPSSVQRRAREIGASWSSGDDRRLLDEDLEPGASRDWRSMGQRDKPPREAEVVQIRRNFLRSKEDLSTGAQSSRESSAEIRRDTRERRPWTEDEITTLRAYKVEYPYSWEEVCERLPGRTLSAIKTWWRFNHPDEHKKITFWEPEEFIILKEYVAGHDKWDLEELRTLFPHRNQPAIKKKWRLDGIPWSKKEDNYLRGIQVLPDTDWDRVAAHTSMQARSAMEAYIRQDFVARRWALGENVGSLGASRRIKPQK